MGDPTGLNVVAAFGLESRPSAQRRHEKRAEVRLAPEAPFVGLYGLGRVPDIHQKSAAAQLDVVLGLRLKNHMLERFFRITTDCFKVGYKLMYGRQRSLSWRLGRLARWCVNDRHVWGPPISSCMFEPAGPRPNLS
ncbi:hypothetical protein KR018_012572 [Drosophila ironensis]|nr:hypothetical protein KR018_012572 [Drosophila ironensis]